MDYHELNGSPEHCLKLERWQGPPNIKKVKQDEVVLSFKVSYTNKVFFYLVCLGFKKKSPNEKLSHLIKISSPKLHTAALTST